MAIGVHNGLLGIHTGMSTVMQFVEVLGIVAFACSGFIEAHRRQMDVVGVFTIAFITAFGGGTLRDILMDRRPLFWIEHPEYTLLVFLLALIVVPLMKYFRSAIAERTIIVADALGLGLFSAVGTSLAQQAGMPIFVCVMMGVITGIFGGVLRDVLCNEIPMVFRRGQLYATCSFAGCWIYLLLEYLAAPQSLALAASVAVTSAFRLLALRFDLRLPG